MSRPSRPARKRREQKQRAARANAPDGPRWGIIVVRDRKLPGSRHRDGIFGASRALVRSSGGAS